MATQFRPLSPHLQIWRFTLSMALSIIHRITGVGLYLGTALVALWLAGAALGEDAYNAVSGFFGHPLILFVLFVYTLVLFHHMAGGIKFLIWDTGTAMDKAGRQALGWATIAFSVVMTVLVWSVFVWF